jgi:hypothetical protein
MSSEMIQDLATKAVYEIDHNDVHSRLGQGALGAIFLGKLVQGSGEQKVAIKRVHPGLDQLSKQSFFSEKEILEGLMKTPAASHVVWVHEGRLQSLEPQEADSILIMKYVDPHGMLSHRLQDGRLPEVLGLKVIMQYAALMSELHKMEYSISGDRKEGDFFWEEGENLLVLDWNRAKKIPSYLPMQDQEKYKQDDIHAFGSIIVHQMIGTKMPVLPDPDDMALKEWGDLTRATRKLLFRMRSLQSTTSFSSAAELCQAAEQLLQWFETATSNPQRLLDQAQVIKASAEGQANPVKEQEAADQVLDLYNLAYSKYSSLSEPSPVPEKDGQLLSWANGILEQERAGLQKIIDDIKRQIKQGAFAKASDLANQELNRLDETISRDVRAGLRLRRWFIAANLHQAMDAQDMSVSTLTDKMSAYLAEIEKLALSGDASSYIRTINSAERSFELAKTELKNKPDLLKLIEPLSYELSCVRNWYAGEQAVIEGRTADIPVLYNKAGDELSALEQLNPPYAKAVRAGLLALNEWVLSRRKEHDQKQDHAALVRLFNQSFETLSKKVIAWTARPSQPANEIMQEIGNCLQLYQTIAENEIFPKDEVEAVQKEGNVIYALQTLAIFRPDQTADQMAAIFEQAAAFPGEMFADLKGALIHAALLTAEKIEAFVKWPDQIKDWKTSLGILEAAGPTVELTSEDSKRLSGLRTCIGEKDQNYKRLVQLCPESPLDNLDNPAVDQTLQEAARLGIELYPREGTQEEWQARKLLLARANLRLQNCLNGIKENLEKVVPEIKSHVTELNSHLSQVKLCEDDLIRVTDALPAFVSVIEALRREKNQIEGIQTEIKAFDQQLSEVDAKFKQYEAITDISGKLLTELSHKIEQLRETQDELSSIELVSKGGDLLNRVLVDFYLLRGVQSALDFESSAARESLDSAGRIIKEMNQTDYREADLRTLSEVCCWFEKVDENLNLQSALLDWRNVLQSAPDATQLVNARARAKAALREADLKNHWLISMYNEKTDAAINALRVPEDNQPVNNSHKQAVHEELLSDELAWECLAQKVVKPEELLSILNDWKPVSRQEQVLLAAWSNRYDTLCFCNSKLNQMTYLISTILDKEKPSNDREKALAKFQTEYWLMFEQLQLAPAEVFPALEVKWKNIAEGLRYLEEHAKFINKVRFSPAMEKLNGLVNRKVKIGQKILGVLVEG